MNHYHYELFDNVATTTLSIIHKFKPWGLCDLVNVFSKIDNHCNPELFDNVATALIPVIH